MKGFRVLSIAALGLALTVSAIGVSGVAAQTGPTTAGNNRVTIELDCEGDPETVKVTNKGNKDLTIRRLTSIVDPINREPFKIDETLKKGQGIKFETGDGARGKYKLSDQAIFDNKYPEEGVVLRTSDGTFEQKCDA